MRRSLPFLAAACLAATLPAAAAPIDKFVTIQPIAVCDDAGGSCANADGIIAATAAVTNAVWSQAGIAMSFLPTRRFNETDYLVTDVNPGNAATDEGRRLLRTPGQQQSDNPTTLNMYFVPQLRDASNGFANLNGFAFINSNGIIIGGSPRLDTIAHEIGHNLGLDHATFGAGAPNNVMTDGPSRTVLPSIGDVAPNGANLSQLNAAQIAKAREPLFSVNHFSLQLKQVLDATTGTLSGVRTFSGYSLAAYPSDEQSYVRPGSPDLPPAGERLKGIRLRFLPGSDVVAALTTGYGWLDALQDPGAVFVGGDLTRSLGTVTYYNVDPVAPGPSVACPYGPLCSFTRIAMSERRVLADGTVELFWPLDGDSFGEAAALQFGNSLTALAAARRTLPPFAVWDEILIDVSQAADPFVGADVAPMPFSVLFEFTSGLTSQGFFDVDGVASMQATTSAFAFVGDPSYGFVSALRPVEDPEIAISYADALDPTAVPSPGSGALLLAALAALSLRGARPAMARRRQAAMISTRGSMALPRVLPAILFVGATMAVPAAAAPIDKFVTIQPIAVCDDAGGSCANADGIIAATAAVTNAVWSQAGIAMSFLPTRRFNETDYLVTDVNPGNAATDEGRRLLRTPGQQQSDNPTTLNMYFVPQLRDASNGFANLNGFAFINSNGIIIGGSPRLDTIAHEIGHNLGLDHATFGAGAPNNVMTDGPSRTVLPSIGDVAPNGANLSQLNAAQIAKAREPLFSVNQFALRVTDGGFDGFTTGLRYFNGYSPTALPTTDADYVRPGDPRLPPAGEKLKAVRLRFLPGSDVQGIFFAGYGYLAALQDPGARFLPDGSIDFSPTPVSYYWVDPPPASASIRCPSPVFSCPDILFPLADKRVLPDGTVELFWQIDGDSFGQRLVELVQSGPATAPVEPPAQRTLPPFTPWDFFQFGLWKGSSPFTDMYVPSPFSVLYEFTSGFASQGFFDSSGEASTLAPTTTTSFVGEPSYGFLSALRPAEDPEIAVSLADVPVPAPGSLASLLAALVGLAPVARRRFAAA